MKGYPAEWRERIPGRVFACLQRGELKILVCPGADMVNGGVLTDVPIKIVPFELRMPNTNVWLKFDESMRVVRVWRRGGF